MPPEVEKFSEDLLITYKNDITKPQPDNWIPYPSTPIAYVTVMHYKNRQIQQELINRCEHLKTHFADFISSPPLHTKVTKDIKDIFQVDPSDQTIGATENKPPKLILIEGAPGIGKTVLAKQIAYLWADHKLLTDCKLVFLVYLRDPRVHEMKSIEELLRHFTSDASEVGKYMEQRSGQNIAFIFDGFDEFSTTQEDSIVKDIIGFNRYVRKFPRSVVVITSRPTATINLHELVNRRIEILGLAPEERKKLISLSVLQFPDKEQLKEYFMKHPIINSLCYIPLNLAILLYLFKRKRFPEKLTEINEAFVIHTVYRCIKKNSTLNITKNPIRAKHIKDFPEDIVNILNILSELAFKGLQKNQLVFKSEDIPSEVRNKDNGLSLLEAVEHDPLEGAGDPIISYNFRHLTMQEYLAAYYVSNLPEEQQLTLLQTTFWDGHFNFMWMMYAGIVGVTTGAFASFVEMINKEFSKNKIKCLQFFQCYMEANKGTEIPQAVSSVFAGGNITFSGITLLSHHFASLLLFMFSSVKHGESLEFQLKSLELSNCNLQKNEMDILLEHIDAHKVRMSTLKYIDLSENAFSPWDVYCAIIKYCSGDSLTLCGDEGIKEHIDQITNVLNDNKTLQSLTLCSIRRIGIESIKKMLRKTTKLKTLNLSWKKLNNENTLKYTKLSSSYIKDSLLSEISTDTNRVVNVNINILYDDDDHNQSLPSSFDIACNQNYESKSIINISGKWINDDAVHVLAFGLCNNTTIKVLKLSSNFITDEGAIAIIDCLKQNKTLKKLDLSQNQIRNHKMDMIVEEQKTTSFLEYVDLSENMSSPWSVYCAIIRYCYVNSLTLCGDEGMEKCIQNIKSSLQENTKLQSLTLLKVGKIGVESIREVLMNNFTIQKLNLSWQKTNSNSVEYILIKTLFASKNAVAILTKTTVNIDDKASDSQLIAIRSDIVWNQSQNSKTAIDLTGKDINDDAAYVLAFGLCNNTTVEELNISNNYITGEGIIAIIDSLKCNKTLKKLDASQNNLSISGMEEIQKFVRNPETALSLQYIDLSKNGPLQYIDPSKNGPLLWNIYSGIIRHCLVSSLTLCGEEGMEKCIGDIKHSLQENTKLQSLTLLNIGKIGVESIKKVLMNNLTIKKLNLSWRKINNTDVERCLLHTSFPHAHGEMQTETTENNTNRVVSVSVNILYDDDDDDDDDDDQLLSSSSNIVLNENYVPKTIINLSGKRINDEAAHVLSFGLYNNTIVKELNLSDNEISNEGAAAIINCLKHNKTLTKLDLSKNKIASDELISECIVNQGITLSLIYVDMHNNHSTFSLWRVYCAIIRHCCVNSLTLVGNEGMKMHIEKIMDSWHVNKGLQQLTLCNIGKDNLATFKNNVISLNESQKRNNSKMMKTYEILSLDPTCFTISLQVIVNLPNIDNQNITNDDDVHGM